MKCDYCGLEAECVTGREIYPHRQDLWSKTFYRCVPCKAYVGCHPNTATPLGRLANLELRKAKSAAHAAFDPIWKSKKMSRGLAYEWLSSQLGISRTDCHIGMFDVAQCKQVVVVCKMLMQGAV